MSDPLVKPDISSNPSKPLRICLIQPHSTPSSRFVAAWTDLCDAACRAGHLVTLATADETGIDVVQLDGTTRQHRRVAPFGQNRLVGARATQVAYVTYLWLTTEAFDVVCAPTLGGSLVYALMAREQGLEFQTTTFVHGLDGFTFLEFERTQELPDGTEPVIQHVMEQRTLALTDWITILDPTTEEWVERWGWKLPARILPLSSTHGEFEALLHALANEPQPWSNLRPVAVDEHMPLVSICITHFNRLALLRQAIDSIGYSIVRC